MNIEFLDLAEEELKEAIDYYNTQKIIIIPKVKV